MKKNMPEYVSTVYTVILLLDRRFYTDISRASAILQALSYGWILKCMHDWQVLFNLLMDILYPQVTGPQLRHQFESTQWMFAINFSHYQVFFQSPCTCWHPVFSRNWKSNKVKVNNAYKLCYQFQSLTELFITEWLWLQHKFIYLIHGARLVYNYSTTRMFKITTIMRQNTKDS